MMFGVKMDFTRKARFVSGGHMTELPASITYSSVVARDSVRLGFMLAAFHELAERKSIALLVQSLTLMKAVLPLSLGHYMG